MITSTPWATGLQSIRVHCFYTMILMKDSGLFKYGRYRHERVKGGTLVVKESMTFLSHLGMCP